MQSGSVRKKSAFSANFGVVGFQKCVGLGQGEVPTPQGRQVNSGLTGYLHGYPHKSFLSVSVGYQGQKPHEMALPLVPLPPV